MESNDQFHPVEGPFQLVDAENEVNSNQKANFEIIVRWQSMKYGNLPKIFNISHDDTQYNQARIKINTQTTKKKRKKFSTSF